MMRNEGSMVPNAVIMLPRIPRSRYKKIAFGSAVCAGLFFIDVPIPRNAVH